MKRNQQTVTSSRRGRNRLGKSRYAAKLAAGNMMYGPGCCGHSRKIRPLQQSPEPHTIQQEIE